MTATLRPMSARLVLASTSRWRLALLADAGIAAEGVDPAVDEDPIVGVDPVDTARLRARAKAEAVWERLGGGDGLVVVGADQVAHLDGEAFGKPRSPTDHLARLRRLRGRAHTLSTGVALVDAAGTEVFVEHTRVRFRGGLSDDELAAYVASEEGAGCAGGYMAERRGAWLIEGIEGDWQNVIGLPVFALVSRLRARGWSLLSLEDGP